MVTLRICYLDEQDVVRHRLVQSIIEAYENLDQKRQENTRSGSYPNADGNLAASMGKHFSEEENPTGE